MSRGIDILRASACTFHWLCYLSKATDNDKLIAECAIKYPFVESLERHFVSNVTLELKHPIYKGRNIDLYIGIHSDKNEFDKSEKEPVFVEFKFLKESTKPKDVFFDLLRLRSIKMKYPKSSCYLIVYGEKLVFNRLLISRSPDNMTDMTEEVKGKLVGNGVLSMWLSLKDKKLINFNGKKTISYRKWFYDEYKTLDGKDHPIENLSTKLVKLFDKEEGIDTLFSFGVWEVL
ncbi:MAG: hypothetical protein NDJ65_01675 [Paludibacteraceae bacterium]|nr:hypothetical protein [Paludibacteraceae bacterium]